ncbi:MAG: rhodanese-like domain-containing protein [Cytophagaceae bacterium]|nr:MAG: rhodanese-like domain-containing protein [Cytophagaceae bacterium]
MRVLLTIFLCSLLVWSCNPNGTSTVQQLSVADFKTAIEASAPNQLIDVRTDDEVSQGVIANARQIDIASPDFEQKLDQLDKSVPVYVYCAIGGRSAQAAQILAQKGFSRVYNLADGMQGWLQAGQRVSPLRR